MTTTPPETPHPPPEGRPHAPGDGEPEAELRHAELRRRDATSLGVLGGFFCVFALLVLVATSWEERSHAAAVNVAAGCVLLAIGVGMLLASRSLARRR